MRDRLRVMGARGEDMEVSKPFDLSDQAGLPHLVLNQTLPPAIIAFSVSFPLGVWQNLPRGGKKLNSHLRLKNTKEREFNKVVVLVSRKTV